MGCQGPSRVLVQPLCNKSLTRHLQMNKTESLPFRTFVPSLVAGLEDADAGVRETAKSAVVELFRYV
jgi:hypothetical protein